MSLRLDCCHSSSASRAGRAFNWASLDWGGVGGRSKLPGELAQSAIQANRAAFDPLFKFISQIKVSHSVFKRVLHIKRRAESQASEAESGRWVGGQGTGVARRALSAVAGVASPGRRNSSLQPEVSPAPGVGKREREREASLLPLHPNSSLAGYERV